MGEAAFWGIVTTSSLLIGGAIALQFQLRRNIVGLVLAFGAGALISAIAYELLGDTVLERDTSGIVGALVLGALVFIIGDLLIDKAGGSDRKSGHVEGGNRGLAIVLGTVLDGIPESFVLGLTLITGDVSTAFVAAVFISNIPESLGATASLKQAGWKHARIMGMWAGIAAVCIVASVLGYAFFDNADGPDRPARRSLHGGRHARDVGRYDDAGGVRAGRSLGRPGDRPRVHTGCHALHLRIGPAQRRAA